MIAFYAIHALRNKSNKVRLNPTSSIQNDYGALVAYLLTSKVFFENIMILTSTYEIGNFSSIMPLAYQKTFMFIERTFSDELLFCF